MGYIIAHRNPRTGKLSILSDAEGTILEFKDKTQAAQAAGEVEKHRYWGYEIVKVSEWL